MIRSALARTSGCIYINNWCPNFKNGFAVNIIINENSFYLGEPSHLCVQDLDKNFHTFKNWTWENLQKSFTPSKKFHTFKKNRTYKNEANK